MTNHLQTWVNHVKQWASNNNCKYGQALKSVECRNSYKKGNSNDEPVSEVKAKRKYTRKIKVEAPTELPKEVLNVIQKRKYTRKTPQIPAPI